MYDNLDQKKYVYVEAEVADAEGFKPPTSWRVMDAMGNYMYFKARDRKKAQELCDQFFGCSANGISKYTVRSDKKVSVR